jgi:hypothetical protein
MPQNPDFVIYYMTNCWGWSWEKVAGLVDFDGPADGGKCGVALEWDD